MGLRTTFGAVAAIGFPGDHRRTQLPFGQVIRRIQFVHVQEPQQMLPMAVQAAETVSFCGLKTGFMKPAAKPYVGKVTVADIGAPIELLRALATG